MICTPCGDEVPEGRSAIYGVDLGDGGRLVFGWTCCHKPVGDVAVIIASSGCLEKWLRENPEYTEDVGLLFCGAAHDHRGNG
jgi:hypothetical protein